MSLEDAIREEEEKRQLNWISGAGIFTINFFLILIAVIFQIELEEFDARNRF